MNVRDALIEESRRLGHVAAMAMEDLGKAPEGRLAVRRERGRTRYYLRCSGSPRMVYLSERRDMELIRALAQKAYAERVLREACRQRALIDRFVADYDPKAVSGIAYGPGREGMVSPYMKEASDGPFPFDLRPEVDPVLVRQLKDICSRILDAN